LRSVVLDVVDERGDSDGAHLVRWVRLEQREGMLDGHVGIQPVILCVTGKDHGHAVMYLGHELVGQGCDDRAGAQPVAVRVLPRGPEAGEREQSTFA
jgi:hypothetical protein